MSSTHSSRRQVSESDGRAVVRKLVTERAGRQWCLFLDRDGVINRQIVGDYVRSWTDFEWLPDAKRALRALSEWAPHIVIVTNQQGVGKGLMSVDDVEVIHHNLRSELAADGVFIDAIQVCPHLESVGCMCRKPRPGLALAWLQQHSAIEDSLSIVVGDSKSDIELAQSLAIEMGGCASIRIGHRAPEDRRADATFDSLWDFAATVARIRGGEVSPTT